MYARQPDADVVEPACRRSARATGAAVYVDPRLDLTHRRVLAAAGAGDVDYGLTEQLLSLLGRIIEQVRHRSHAGRRELRTTPKARWSRRLAE